MCFGYEFVHACTVSNRRAPSMASLGARAASPAPLGWPSGRRSRKALPCGNINYLKSATMATIRVWPKRCVRNCSSRPKRVDYSPLEMLPSMLGTPASLEATPSRRILLRRFQQHHYRAAVAVRLLHRRRGAVRRAMRRPNNVGGTFLQLLANWPRKWGRFCAPLYGPFLIKTCIATPC